MSEKNTDRQNVEKMPKNKLEFENNELFHYLIWTSGDYGNFLRTLTVARQEPIKDKKIECKWVMLAMQEKMDREKLNFSVGKITDIRVQVYFARSAKEVMSYKEINENIGYPYVYTFLAEDYDVNLS